MYVKPTSIVKANNKTFIARLPLKVVDITPDKYSSKEQIDKIIAAYLEKLKKQRINIKTLITSHGYLHPRRSFLPLNSSILLDINPGCEPDIVGDLLNSTFMSRFPENFFDLIYVTYTFPPTPLSSKNNNLWFNLKCILKPKGRLISYYMFYVMRLKYPNIDFGEIIKIHLGKWFHVTMHRNFVTLTKL